VKREWREELNCEIEVLEHIYTTDFFQASAFHTDTQIISIYYRVRPVHVPAVEYDAVPFSFSGEGPEELRFRRVSLHDLRPEDVTFPIDKLVTQLVGRAL